MSFVEVGEAVLVALIGELAAETFNSALLFSSFPAGDTTQNVTSLAPNCMCVKPKAEEKHVSMLACIC
jgi:hypothetical protein